MSKWRMKTIKELEKEGYTEIRGWISQEIYLQKNEHGIKFTRVYDSEKKNKTFEEIAEYEKEFYVEIV